MSEHGGGKSGRSWRRDSFLHEKKLALFDGWLDVCSRAHSPDMLKPSCEGCTVLEECVKIYEQLATRVIWHALTDKEVFDYQKKFAELWYRAFVKGKTRRHGGENEENKTVAVKTEKEPLKLQR
jgi:hypothetical protein